jgi:hypothetical protein
VVDAFGVGLREVHKRSDSSDAPTALNEGYESKAEEHRDDEHRHEMTSSLQYDKPDEHHSNGGVAFGAALAGGAIGGPMVAFMALPIAALIASFLSHYRKPQEVIYHSRYEDASERADAPNKGSLS